MEKNGLQLSAGEEVVKRYDFQDSYGEDSLIVTNNRLIRREINGNSFFHKEVLLSDVNQITASCQTSNTRSGSKTDPKKIAFLIVSALLFIVFFVMVTRRGTALKIMSIIFLAVGVVFLVFALKIQDKPTYIEKTLLKILVIDRDCDNCVISIEKTMNSQEVAWGIANEIGSILFRIRSNQDATATELPLGAQEEGPKEKVALADSVDADDVSDAEEPEDDTFFSEK